MGTEGPEGAVEEDATLARAKRERASKRLVDWIGRYQIDSRLTHTIRTVADEASPAALCALDEAHLDLYLADRVVARIRVDLPLERLEDERFLAVCVCELWASRQLFSQLRDD